MRITRIAVNNYKALREVDVAVPSPLVAIVGRNNSGKSALLDVLRIASESTQHSNVNPPPSLTARGGWEEVIFAKAPTEQPIEIELGLEAPFHEFGLAFDPSVPPRDPPEVACTYRLHLFQDHEERKVDFDFGKEGTVTFEYAGPGGLISQGNLQFNPTVFSGVMSGMPYLAADRRVEHEIGVAGGATLASDGTNLIQVLNDLASSRRQVFNAIIQTAQFIIPEIAEFLARLQPGGNIASGSIREKAFGDTEFGWLHLSSGTRQVVLLSTFLHTAPQGSLLLIEEPELYLHTESVWRLLEVFEEQTETRQKQVLFTTHSPVVIERLGLQSSLVAARDASTGESRVESLGGFASLDTFLEKHGFMTHELLLPSSGVKPLASLLLVLEGPDDAAIWPKFISRARLPLEKMKLIHARNGGWAEAGKAAALFKKLHMLGLPAVRSLLIVESDEDRDTKITKLREYGLDEADYHILPLDIEAYLINISAISSVLNKPSKKVQQAVRKAGGKPSKEKFETILAILGAKPNRDTKKRLAGALPRLPKDIRSVTDLISSITSGSA